jgi:serine/threonine-protein kinase ATR
MLVYLITHAILDGYVRLNSPFVRADKARAEVVKALSLFRITMRETPGVLVAGVGGGGGGGDSSGSSHSMQPAPRDGAGTIEDTGSEMRFRGRAPLWVWLFPRILRLLGHPVLADARGAIVDFFNDVWAVAAQAGVLWGMLPLMGMYLRQNLGGESVGLRFCCAWGIPYPCGARRECPRLDSPVWRPLQISCCGAVMP